MIKVKANEELFNEILQLKWYIQFIASIVQNDYESSENTVEENLKEIEYLKSRIDSIEQKLRKHLFN